MNNLFSSNMLRGGRALDPVQCPCPATTPARWHSFWLETTSYKGTACIERCNMFGIEHSGKSLTREVFFLICDDARNWLLFESVLAKVAQPLWPSPLATSRRILLGDVLHSTQQTFQALKRAGILMSPLVSSSFAVDPVRPMIFGLHPREIAAAA